MRTEILSPAGNKESFISAIHHGCDAIYIGGLKFGARAQAPMNCLKSTSSRFNGWADSSWRLG